MRRKGKLKNRLAKQWLNKAEGDLKTAKILIASKISFYFTAGFHAQQAAEKYLKAYLTIHEIEFPKTHAIEKLLDLIEIIDPDLAKSLQDAIILSDYAVESRYPGDFPDLTKSQAQKAVALAEKVKRTIMKRIKK